MTRHADQVGRFCGITVFIAGIVLLTVIFVFAFRMFTHPVPELAAIIHNASVPLKPGQAPPPSALPAIGAAIVVYAGKVGLLLLGVIVGSIISSRGISLYLHAAGSGHPSAPPSLTLTEAPGKSDTPGPKSSAGNQ